jgi:cell division protein FtsZ
MGVRESFKVVDNVLARAVTGISGVILSHGESDINIDFADLSTVMSNKGMALMGVGDGSGSDAAYQAVKNAIESPLFDNISINGAMGVLVHFAIHPEYPLVQIQQAMNVIYESADESADIIFGTTTNPSVSPDRVVVTIVATGFERQANNSVSKSTPLNITSIDTNMPDRIQPTRIIRKVSGGYNLDLDDNELEIPTYLRRQMD